MRKLELMSDKKILYIGKDKRFNVAVFKLGGHVPYIIHKGIAWQYIM